MSSVNPNYNGLQCAHYLPGDRVDSLLNMTDSENPDRLLPTVAILTPSIVVVWANDVFIMKDGAVLCT